MDQINVQEKQFFSKVTPFARADLPLIALLDMVPSALLPHWDMSAAWQPAAHAVPAQRPYKGYTSGGIAGEYRGRCSGIG